VLIAQLELGGRVTGNQHGGFLSAG
jgi:hypothetical protein